MDKFDLFILSKLKTCNLLNIMHTLSLFLLVLVVNLATSPFHCSNILESN